MLKFFFVICFFLVSACASFPKEAHAQHPQLVRGKTIPILDWTARAISFPINLILWNWKFSSHSFSAKSEEELIKYIDKRSAASFEETIFRLNQYDPAGDLKALFKNKHVAWPYRIILGFPITFIYDVLLPGRLFPWGDYFNPFTNVVHLYSDDFAIAMHEAGHAYDQGVSRYKGTYALIRVFYIVTLYQEWWATDDAIDFLIDTGNREGELHAYRSLWPAYGTYIGGAVPIPYAGSVIGSLGGHICATLKIRSRKKYFERMDTVMETPHRYYARQTNASVINLATKY